MQSLPEQLVAEFFSEYSRSRSHNRDLIARLTRLALSEDPVVAEPATRAIFASLVERLADSFEPEAAALYNRVFAQIIQICREDSRAVAIDCELTAFGLPSEEDIISRAEALRLVPRLAAQRDMACILKQVLVLSRVTLGADVAITSVIIERMKVEYPASEIFLLGGRKTKELFGGDPRLQFKELVYRRGGVLIERLLAWIDLLTCVRELTRGLTNDEYLVVDPDSRLTQLGLLPVTHNAGTGPAPNYVFFPSREYGSNTSRSLAELTGAWLDENFGESATTDPWVCLRREDVEVAHRLASKLRAGGSRRIVALNFGVGTNSLKRVGDEFEISLVNCLAREGVAIILDKGAGVEESARVDKVVGEATRNELDRRVVLAEVDEGNLIEHFEAPDFDTDILVWNGRIGMLAALIGESDLYIGYDSAGQHIAAALGVPCIDVFAGYSSESMVDRWRPSLAAGMIVAGNEAFSSRLGTTVILREVIRRFRGFLK